MDSRSEARRERGSHGTLLRAAFVSGALLAALLVLGPLACATTRVETQWRDPTVRAEDLAFRRVVVIAQVEEDTIRRAAEDALVRVLSTNPRAQSYGTQFVPSYSFIPKAQLDDVPGLRAAVASAGFDGAVVMRLVSDEERVTYVPGHYDTWWGYTVGPYDPGYTTRDRIVRIETRLFSVAQKKLLWAGITRTMNPREVDHLVEGVVHAVGRELEKQGL